MRPGRSDTGSLTPLPRPACKSQHAPPPLPLAPSWLTARPPPLLPPLPCAVRCAVRLVEAAPLAAFYVCDLLKAHSAQSSKHRQVS